MRVCVRAGNSLSSATPRTKTSHLKCIMRGIFSYTRAWAAVCMCRLLRRCIYSLSLYLTIHRLIFICLRWTWRENLFFFPKDQKERKEKKRQGKTESFWAWRATGWKVGYKNIYRGLLTRFFHLAWTLLNPLQRVRDGKALLHDNKEAFHPTKK